MVTKWHPGDAKNDPWITLRLSLKKSSVKKSVCERVRFLSVCVRNSRMRALRAAPRPQDLTRNSRRKLHVRKNFYTLACDRPKFLIPFSRNSRMRTKIGDFLRDRRSAYINISIHIYIYICIDMCAIAGRGTPVPPPAMVWSPSFCGFPMIVLWLSFGLLIFFLWLLLMFSQSFPTVSL